VHAGIPSSFDDLVVHSLIGFDRETPALCALRGRVPGMPCILPSGLILPLPDNLPGKRGQVRRQLTRHKELIILFVPCADDVSGAHVSK
jgi:hypothetical protein